MCPSVIVASEDKNIRELARTALTAEGLEPILCGDGLEAYESAQSQSHLKLILLEMFLPKMDGFEVVLKLEDSSKTKEIPVLMLISKKGDGNVPLRLRADNYLQKPFDVKELKSEIHSMVKHFRKHNGPHPVTGLEGHPQLEQEIVTRLGRNENFSTLWMDINYFRPFNDHYGTPKGNEVLKMFTNLIHEILKSLNIPSKSYHLAHVDGDDFILLLTQGELDKIKSTLREDFQEEVLKFYSNEEKEKGFIYQKSREEKDEIYPLMRLSMALLNVSKEKFLHYGQLVSQARELLHQAKIGAQDVK